MKLPVKVALLSASTGLLMTSAFAASTLVPVSKNSVYISGDAGYGVLSTPDKNLADADGIIITGASHSNDSFAGGANVGFNRALKNNVLVGAEFGYDYNGQAKYTEDFVYSDSLTAKVSSWNLHLLATGTYLFNNGINLFAKAGAARVEQKVSFSGNSADNIADVTDTKYQPMLAAGVGYRVKMVNIFAQYARTFGKNASSFGDLFNSDGSANVVSASSIKLGVAYNIAI